ncbi:hypothetical protein ARMSODRAFT_963698 [Armillaria solidipes]|uniref:Uncharacterized protein n=1 Tax=Armillaria solidipes TaxID=1076256 RepID=A0A2H3BGA2_9AGAR|nr:hypothetical protein ARMSODRAFT_963698 [Armillaria solidipes]
MTQLCHFEAMFASAGKRPNYDIMSDTKFILPKSCFSTPTASSRLINSGIPKTVPYRGSIFRGATYLPPHQRSRAFSLSSGTYPFKEGGRYSNIQNTSAKNGAVMRVEMSLETPVLTTFRKDAGNAGVGNIRTLIRENVAGYLSSMEEEESEVQLIITTPSRTARFFSDSPV